MMGSSIYSEQWSVFKARELPQNKILEADVVIIGSGAGGGITAEVLAKKGLKVIIIEEGPY
ncbi:MAG: ribulose 1,5-bisphosphate synthetase/thiazole synthase, partial [Enterobacterales bacterium]